MRQNYYTYRLLLCIVTLPALFYSCVYPAYGPLMVPENRQKENLYYVPSALHAPLLQEKNDLSSSFMMSFAGDQVLTEFQAAYVPINHLGFTLNYSKLLEGEKLMQYNRFEVGTGYILPFSGNWLFETYGGWGTGEIKNLHQTGLSNIKSNHLFLQPSISINNRKKTLQFAFVSKLSRLHFANVHGSFDTSSESFSASQINRLHQDPFQYFWEPGFIFRVGWKHFMFHSSFTASKNMSNINLSQAKGNFSLGMTLRFSTGSKGVGPISAASLPRIE